MMAAPSERLRQIAVAHLLALEDPEASDERILAAVTWIEENEQNYQLAREISRFSGICERLPRDLAPAAESVASNDNHWIWRWSSARVAASIAVMMVIGIGLFVFLMDGLSRHSDQANLEYFTEVGESRVITLPDNSRVTLGAGSNLRVSYDAAVRRITLTSGEAFFDVARNKDRPLLVQTEDGDVTALGTAFNVHHAPGSTTVTLIHGRVKVETSQGANGPVAYLRPNTQVDIQRQGGLSRVRPVDGNAALAWQKGRYRYDDAPLATIVSDLRRYYRKPILLTSSSLNDMRFTGVVNLRGGDIDQWLRGLRNLGAVDVSVRDDMVVISPQARPSEE